MLAFSTRAVLVLAAIAAAGGAFAQVAPEVAPPTDAIVTLREGVRALRAGQSELAVTLITRAAAAGAGPLAWYNLGLAHRIAGHAREAIEAWRRYVAAPELNAPVVRVDAVRDEIAEIERSLPTAPPAAAPPTPAPIIAPPTIAVPPAPSADLTTIPAPHVVAPHVVAPRARTPVPAWTWVGLGAAALGTLTAVALAVDGSVSASEYDRRCEGASTSGCVDEGAALQSRLDGYSVSLIVAAGVGVIGATVMVVGLLRGASTREGTRALNVGAGALTLRW